MFGFHRNFTKGCVRNLLRKPIVVGDAFIRNELKHVLILTNQV